MLQNDLMYEATCTFNKPLGGCSKIKIGLLEDTLKDTTEVEDGHLNFNSNPYYGSGTVVRGVALNSSPLNGTLT